MFTISVIAFLVLVCIAGVGVIIWDLIQDKKYEEQRRVAQFLKESDQRKLQVEPNEDDIILDVTQKLLSLKKLRIAYGVDPGTWGELSISYAQELISAFTENKQLLLKFNTLPAGEIKETAMRKVLNDNVSCLESIKKLVRPLNSEVTHMQHRVSYKIIRRWEDKAVEQALEMISEPL